MMNSGIVSNPKQTFDISWIQKDTKCWVYQPNEMQGQIYLRGIIKGIIPLSINKANSKISGVLQMGSPFQVKANQIQKCRDSNSLERDLIDMDIINAPQVIRQLKRRLSQKKIHTLIWNSLIIVNPFRLIPDQYSQRTLAAYFQHIFQKKEDLRRHEPHIYSFTMHILANLEASSKTQVISISGQSGSGKTETNKESLKAISYVCSRMHEKDKMTISGPESKILSCDPILQTFGNAKTIKNDNSSRFGKLITLIMDGGSLRIHQCMLKNYFLQKSRIISQSLNERGFHIFYQLLNFLPDDQKSLLRLKHNGHWLRPDDFRYITNKVNIHLADDRGMWDDLNGAFNSLGFSTELVKEIWSVVVATLMLGNMNFELISDDEPCEIKNPEIADNVAFLLGLERKQLIQALTTHKRTIGGEIVISPLNQKHCIEGRDSVAKAMYESLFTWLVNELNTRLNQAHSDPTQLKIVKLLDIYGFEVFDYNSFEQLCVNYTNEKIHQIYLQQIFIHEKNLLKKEGLQSVIKKLNFTDNIKIIELIDSSNRSVFNLLDESCSVNVRDDDFLNSIRKNHDHHDHFPPSNLVNTRKSFVIKHTPGDIQYMIEGFRQKNKDLIREDLLARLSNIKIKFIGNAFRQKYQMLKHEGNKRYLSIKIRKQVRELVAEMSTNTDMHFIRCIKPNEKKQAFGFVDRVCYNQIRYLGILDTIQMRKDTYHIRTPYSKFYQKYGILQNQLNLLIGMSEGRISEHDSKEIVMKFINDLNVHYNLDYQFGRQRIFLKMTAQHRLDSLLSKKVYAINWASTRIKAQFKHYQRSKERKMLKCQIPKIQRAIKNYLIHMRVYRRKAAVLKIENAWIKYHPVFFARKKLPLVKTIQKYIKGKKEQILMKEKIKAIQRAKEVLKSVAISNQVCKKVNTYKQMKKMLTGDIYDVFWDSLRFYYLDNMQKYFKGGAVLIKNEVALQKADEITQYRLNIKYRSLIEKYMKGLQDKLRYSQKARAIVKIQSFFRMKRLQRWYLDLRDKTLMIQRNWRKYYYDKQFNMQYTQNYFEDGPAGTMQIETQYWRQCLYRNLEGKQSHSPIQKLLYANERVKMDKIGLFYYLVDFQLLIDLSHIYPNNSWISNYTSLFTQCWQKGNPIQTVDVSDTQTIASTLNKVYTWGDLHFQDFDPDKPSYQNWKNWNSPALPPGKMHKVHAHNGFSVVEIQNQDPYIIGKEKLFEEDCSAKQWKTLTQSYVIINGVILTLKKIQFSRVPINEKIAQLSCGAAHCIAKTSLRKIYSWGDNSRGQLGVGHFKRVTKPKLIQAFSKHAIIIQQASASAYGCVALDINNRVFWWGSNGTISNVSFPKELCLFEKSNFIDNANKYTVVRLVTSWSKSLSLIGVTVAAHEGIFKSSQNQVKKKTYQHLMNKWNEDIHTVSPPYIQTISGYFQEKLMPKPQIKQVNKGLRQLQHQRIRQKLLTQIMLMEQAEKALLKERKRY